MVPGSLSLCVLRLRRELASVGCDGFLIRKTPSVTPRLVQMALLAVARDHQDTKSPIVTVAFFLIFFFPAQMFQHSLVLIFLSAVMFCKKAIF